MPLINKTPHVYIMDVVYLYLFHRQCNMYVDGGGGASTGGDYAARCDAPFIQATRCSHSILF